MPIRVTCPGCHRTFRVADEHAGRRGRCPDCSEVVRIPDEDLPPLNSVEDEFSEDYAEDYVAPRRRPRRRRSPVDDLPAWRRVSTGYLIQQTGTGLNLLAVALIMAGTTLLADDPTDMDKEPTVGQAIATSLGCLAGFLGIILQCVGRFVSAGTPVRAPRALGMISAIGSALQVPALCMIGGLAIVVAGDPAAEAILGLGMFVYITVWVACEAFHCFALGSVGRVLRADGLRVLGRALGIGVIVAGFLVMVGLCGFGAWADANNPNNQNPGANHAENQILLAWLIGTSVVTGLYFMLDVVLLQQGRSAIGRIADESPDGGEEDDWR